MDVVTFSGVTSGGMVTSGTTCWTCSVSAVEDTITLGTKDSFIKDVMIELFPTPSKV